MIVTELSIGNAAGTIKSLLDVEKACGRNAMTEITVGSITVKQQNGNVPDKPYGRVYYYDPNGGWSMNALGLPNMGLTELLRVLPDMVHLAHASYDPKELRVSVAGGSPKEYAVLAEECYSSGADVVELNLGCPNVWGEDGTQKPIPSYIPDLTQDILLAVGNAIDGRKVDVKISPVTDVHTLLELARVFNRSKCVGNVVGVNTIPNVERLGSDGHPALAFNNGNNKGGLAGAEIASASFFVHDTIRHKLDDAIGYKAVGGMTGRMLLKHVRKGAIGFQIATDYLEFGGPAAFTRILEDYSRISEEQQVTTM